MGEFKSWCVFNEEPASKENHRMDGARRARAYWSYFHREKFDGPVYWKILKKTLPAPHFMVMKKFSKFWFLRDGAKAHTADLTLDLVETRYKKCVISNRFPLQKRGLGTGCRTSPISVLWTISSGAM